MSSVLLALHTFGKQAPVRGSLCPMVDARPAVIVQRSKARSLCRCLVSRLAPLCCNVKRIPSDPPSKEARRCRLLSPSFVCSPASCRLDWVFLDAATVEVKSTLDPRSPAFGFQAATGILERILAGITGMKGWEKVSNGPSLKPRTSPLQFFWRFACRHRLFRGGRALVVLVLHFLPASC